MKLLWMKKASSGRRRRRRDKAGGNSARACRGCTCTSAATPNAPTQAKKDAGAKDAAGLDLSSSISNIFNNIDDEENPLANLIKVLPDVAATELLDDLKEINDIIKDWQKK